MLFPELASASARVSRMRRGSKAGKGRVGAMSSTSTQLMGAAPSGTMGSALTPDDIKMPWLERNKQALQEEVARLEGRSPLMGTVLRTRRHFFHGVWYGTWGSDTLRAETEAGFDMGGLLRDVWREYLLQQTAVLFWLRGAEGAAGESSWPRVLVLNSEQVTYENHGAERIKVKWNEQLVKKLLEEAGGDEGRNRGDGAAVLPFELKNLPTGFRNLMSQNDWIYPNDESFGFKVITDAKLGVGPAVPRFGELLFDLSIMSLLKMGDWNGAFLNTLIKQQVKKGHEIRNGPLAGQADWFLWDEEIDPAKKLFSQSGARTLVTNFDVNVDFPHVPKEFFDEEKHKAVRARIEEWGGAALQLAKVNSQAGGLLMQAFEREAEWERGVVLDGIHALLRMEGDFPGAGSVRLRYGPCSFMSNKERREFVSTGVASGVMSHPTARMLSGLDDGWESAEMERSRKEAETKYFPVFEAKQGLLQLVAGGSDGGDGGELGGRPPGEGTAE